MSRGALVVAFSLRPCQALVQSPISGLGSEASLEGLEGLRREEKEDEEDNQFPGMSEFHNSSFDFDKVCLQSSSNFRNARCQPARSGLESETVREVKTFQTLMLMITESNLHDHRVKSQRNTFFNGR